MLQPRPRSGFIVGALIEVLVTCCSVALAPTAAADDADNLRAALVSVRGQACPALRSDPLVERVAQNVADSYTAWLNHTARAIPVPDALPVLTDLGYAGTKATILQGVGHSEAPAFKGLLLQGRTAVPNCAFTDYGATVVSDQPSGYILAVVVLAGA